MAKRRILPDDTAGKGLADSLLRQWRGEGKASDAFSVTRRSVDAGELARQAVKRSLEEEKQFQTA
jgi:hypothetical protein